MPPVLNEPTQEKELITYNDDARGTHLQAVLTSQVLTGAVVVRAANITALKSGNYYGKEQYLYDLCIPRTTLVADVQKAVDKVLCQLALFYYSDKSTDKDTVNAAFKDVLSDAHIMDTRFDRGVKEGMELIGLKKLGQSQDQTAGFEISLRISALQMLKSLLCMKLGFSV